MLRQGSLKLKKPVAKPPQVRFDRLGNLGEALQDRVRRPVGDVEHAIEALETSIKAGFVDHNHIAKDPDLNPLEDLGGRKTEGSRLGDRKSPNLRSSGRQSYEKNVSRR